MLTGFINRDLDSNAEDFIVGWARELPPKHELTSVINLATPAPAERAATNLDAVSAPCRRLGGDWRQLEIYLHD